MVVAVVTDLNLLKTQLSAMMSTFWVDFAAIEKYMSSKLKVNKFIYTFFMGILMRLLTSQHSHQRSSFGGFGGTARRNSGFWSCLQDHRSS